MARDETLELGGIRWHLAPGSERAELAARLRAALAALAAGGVRDARSGRRKRLYALALAREAPPDHLLKRGGYPALRGALRIVGRSKARRELAVALALAERGVPVVVPLAAGERRRAGRLLACWLLTPLLDGVSDVRRHLAQGGGDSPGERRALARALGSLARRAHDAGLFQDDFAPNNVLLRPGPVPELWLVDFERAALRRRVGRAERRWMLAKLDRGLPDVSASQRLRFLRAYDAEAARDWWQELRGFAPRLAARDLARLRRVASADGRRFARLAGPGWSGFARGEAAARSAPDWAAAWTASLPGNRARRVTAQAATWRVGYPGVGRRRARWLWAAANTLFVRGLAPRPLALLLRRGDALLVSERAETARLATGVRGRDERAALARLLGRLRAIGELTPALTAEAVALEPGPDARPRARLVAPDGLRFRTRPDAARSRGVAARLLASLPPSA